MTLDEFLEKLENVKTAGNGFVAICPGHEDRETSLGVTEGDDGRVLVQCYAGCETKHVVESMGLRLADLFPKTHRTDQQPEAVYPYLDEVGNTLFEAVRFPGKRFKQRYHEEDHPDAKADGYVYSLDGIRRVPFRLPELLKAIREGKTVYITEGEKDALRITQETGRFATCNPMGAGKWRDEYTPHFAGCKQVIIVQDRDEPGRRHARKVHEALTSIGVKTIIMQAKIGKDVSDHFDAGFKLEEMLRPRATPKRGIVTSKEMKEAFGEYLQYRDVDLPQWHLLPGIEASGIRPGRIYLVGAYTGDGKTTYALQGARTLSSQGVRCGYFSMEMSQADLMNRLVAHRGVPMSLLERPTLLRADPQMYALAQEAMQEVGEWKLDIIYDTALKVERVVEDTIDREYECIFIDHIHRMSFSDRGGLETQIKALTNLALDQNIPVVILAQLRKFARGKDLASYPAPTLQDFRETSVLGDEASLAIALWRQRDQEGLRYIGDQSQFRVLKNRHTTGRKDKAGHVELLDFNTTTQLFTPGGISSVEREEGLAPANDIEQPLDPQADVWG